MTWQEYEDRTGGSALPICIAGCIVERIGQNPRGESIFRRLTVGNDRWALRRWRTKSFNRLW